MSDDYKGYHGGDAPEPVKDIIVPNLITAWMADTISVDALIDQIDETMAKAFSDLSGLMADAKGAHGKVINHKRADVVTPYLFKKLTILRGNMINYTRDISGMMNEQA